MMAWGKLGAFWGSVWGLLTGAAFFVVPGVGPLVFAGHVAGVFVAALEGAVIVSGLSALGAALYSIGIPKNSIMRFEEALRADKFLLVANGNVEEIDQALEIMQRSGADEASTHDAPARR